MKNSLRTTTIFCVTLVSGILSFTSCKKQDIHEPQKEILPVSSNEMSSAMRPAGNESGLSQQTLWELQQAKAATAKFQNIENAKADGYEDIGVVVPNMGYHFRKLALVDSVFDFRKPELLVYNKDKFGRFQLLAVEYAVPIAQSPNAPEGFTGNADVWDSNDDFGLWTLHAWVWEYNPEGVFHDTNPLVIVR